MEEMEMTRINVRVGKDASAWLDSESKRNGIPKSTLVHLAIEQYMASKQAMRTFADMGELVAAIERLEQAVSNNKDG